MDIRNKVRTSRSAIISTQGRDPDMFLLSRTTTRRRNNRLPVVKAVRTHRPPAPILRPRLKARQLHTTNLRPTATVHQPPFHRRLRITDLRRPVSRKWVVATRTDQPAIRPRRNSQTTAVVRPVVTGKRLTAVQADRIWRRVAARR